MSFGPYPELVTCVGSEELSQVKKFAKNKLYSFAKEENTCFSPDNFIPASRKTSEAGISESDFAQRDHIIEPFKVKIVKDQEVISRRKRIINGLISEISLKNVKKSD